MKAAVVNHAIFTHNNNFMVIKAMMMMMMTTTATTTTMMMLTFQGLMQMSVSSLGGSIK